MSVLLCGCQVYDAKYRSNPLDDAGEGSAGEGGAGSLAPAADGGDAETIDAEAQLVDGIDASASGSGAAGSGGAPEAGSGGAPEAGRSGTSAAGMGGAGASGTSGAGGAGGSSGVGGASGSSGASGTGGAAGSAGAAGASPCVPSGTLDCCPSDPTKNAPGACGCGTPDTDTDADGTADCVDAAPYGFQRRLKLDGTKIAGSLAGFPVLIQLTDAHLQANAASDGRDIYFTASDQLTLLDFELERYASGSGALVAWVRLPSLSAGNDAVFYLGYGDGKSSRANVAPIWSGMQHVFHLSQDPSGGTGAIKDSTQRAHGTSQGSMSATALVPAVAGNGLGFDGTNDFIRFTNTFTGTGASTISAWVKQAADTGDQGSAVMSIGSGNTNQSRFLMTRATVDHDVIKCGFYSNDEATNSVLTLGDWKYVVWVWNGTQTTIYVDGAVVFGPTSHSGANTTGSDGRIGNGGFGYDYFMSGQLDEVRLATLVRPAAWILTEFNNQRPGSTFIESIDAATAAPNH